MNFLLQNLTTMMILFHLFLIFHDVILSATDSAPLPHVPPSSITIDCGSIGSNAALDHRIWKGDINSNFFPTQSPNKASITFEAHQPPTQVSPVPYHTARLSRSNFTYTLPVTSGQKFIRLHFYPALYGDFDCSKAFFSVKAANYTLLTNFSAFLSAIAIDRQVIVKEFCLTVQEDEHNLKVIFAPVSSSNSDSFAFINGIEVLSMPTYLYHSATEEHAPILLMGNFKPYFLANGTAMEMVYRINVGGNLISPAEDVAGMFRSWEGENDYLTMSGYSVSIVELSHKLDFKVIQPYTAPPNVYLTARSMGNKDEAKIKSYKLTWEFPVDIRFYYLVRLHFCEIESVMNKSGDRVFLIYIANQTAEDSADVMYWSGGYKYVPVYKDYVVPMFGEGGEKKRNLSVALQANPDDWRTSYLDGILNGIEIFKLSDNTGNLAAPNPDPPRTQSAVSISKELHRKGKHSRGPITGNGIVYVVIASSALLLSVIGCLMFWRGRKAKSTTNTRGSSLPSDLCRYFSLVEMKIATNNFDAIFIIGRGGFGNVYKGHIDNGTTPVAIKRLKPGSSQGAQEFKTEIEMLSQLRHVHLVSLIGYCDDDCEMILVYDYMERGTLREHLYNSDNPPLSWKRRLQICIGAAHGLHYLHTGAKHTIIHRDVKTTNILLNQKWEAKVSDFGLSKINSISKSHVTTVVKGSLGYLDPEYYKRQQLTEKSDVYSFGVVLCEVLCARPPILRAVETRQMNLAQWAQSCFCLGTIDEIVDENLIGKIEPESLTKYCEMAVRCMVDDGSERPSMNEVAWGLEFALQLQQGAEESRNLSLSGEVNEMKGEDEVPFVNYMEDDGNFSYSWEYTSKKSSANESIKGLSTAVFSEIDDPKGR